MTGDDYDLILHCTSGHLRRVDGALPDFDDGEKALNLARSSWTAQVYILHLCRILQILHIFLFLCGVQTGFAHVAASRWILLLFHDSSWNWHLSPEDPPQICCQN